MPVPSLRYRIEVVHGEMRTGRTEYILGRNTRLESRSCRGYCVGDPMQPGAMRFEYSPLRTVMHNYDLHQCFHLDLESRVYTAFLMDEYGGPRGVRPMPISEQRSGRTVRIHTRTVDTGERREMRGHSARRVITRTTHTYDPGTGSPAFITEADGWYIDPPPAWLAAHPPVRAYIVFEPAGTRDTPVFTDDGPRETGFPLLRLQRCRTAYTDAEGNMRTHSSEDREEVTELSEEDLEFDLFLPPRDFRRVSQLPGEPPLPFRLRGRICWERLKEVFFLSKRN